MLVLGPPLHMWRSCLPKIYGADPVLYFIPQQYLVSVLIDELILALCVLHLLNLSKRKCIST